MQTSRTLQGWVSTHHDFLHCNAQLRGVSAGQPTVTANVPFSPNLVWQQSQSCASVAEAALAEGAYKALPTRLGCGTCTTQGNVRKLAEA